jgi:hypothetical protein
MKTAPGIGPGAITETLKTMNEKDLQLPALMFFPVNASRKTPARRRYFGETKDARQIEIEKIDRSEWLVNIQPGHDVTFQTLRDAKAWIGWTPQLRQV